MTRWGNHSSKNRELWQESQKLYHGGSNPYAVEYQRKYCCSTCKREIRPHARVLLAGVYGEAVACGMFKPALT